MPVFVGARRAVPYKNYMHNNITLKPDARILLVRPDKIGDLILTTPAIFLLRKNYPGAFLAFLCRSYAAPVLENNPAINMLIKSDEGSAFSLAQKLRELKFDASVHFYLDKRCEIASFLGKIPLRIGPFSKPTALFLNERIKQNRSKAVKHEAEYNLDLARRIADDVSSYAPKIYLTEAEKKKGAETINLITGTGGTKPLIIHPGSAGSVKNWPLENFLKLAKLISGAGRRVIFTAGKDEGYVLEKVEAIKDERIHSIPAGSLSLRELMSVISGAQALISNSTGPLHIASALGVPTLSFYPNAPIVTSAKRWRPFGNDAMNRVLSPKNDSNDMSSIPPEDAFSALKEIIM